MASLRFTITPTELAILHKCLSSKICVHIFEALLAKKKLNISAVSRKVGCTNSDGVKHLRNLAELGIVKEEFYAGLHTFALKDGDFTELIKQVIKVLEAEE